MLTVGIENNCNTCFTGTQHLTSIAGQWRYADGSIGCKKFTRLSFSSTETSSIIPYHFFIQATDIIAHPNIINENFISFLWMETGSKLGSRDKFENGKLYSNAITQQNDREPGIVLDSRKNMMINLGF